MNFSKHKSLFSALHPLLFLLTMATFLPHHTTSAAEPDNPLIPRDLLFGNPERTQGRISPDGAVMSFLAPHEGVLNMWAAPTGKLDQARLLTRESGRGVLGHRWALNATHLLYQMDQGGDENQRIYSVDTRTGETRPLTPETGVRALFGGASWQHPDHLILRLNDRDPRWHDLWKVNVVTGEKERILENPGFLAIYTDRSLQPRLALRTESDSGRTLLRLAPSGQWEPFMEIPADDALTTSPLGFYDSNSAFLMLDSRQRNTSALFSIDATTGEATLLAEDERADIDGVLTEPLTGKPLAFSVNYAIREWKALDPSITNDLARLRQSFPKGFSIVDQTRDNNTWLIASDSSEKPLTYFKFERLTGQLTEAFASRPALSDAPLSRMIPLQIPTRDGLQMVSYLTLPRSADPAADDPDSSHDLPPRPSRPLPLVLLVHGGPWSRDSYGFNGLVQWLANRGYAVLQTNFRASSGFGKNFLNAGDREWGAKMHEDLLDAVEWAINNGITTRQNIGIMGGSYGGYAALAAVTFTPGVFSCSVSIVGPSNLETLLASIPPYWTSFYETFARRVGDPRSEEGLQFLKERSPLTFVDRIRDPLLIGQGANDPRVKQAESDQIVAAMQKKGIPVTYVLFPDEGHGFARPENNLAFWAITEAFLSSHLGGRIEPIGQALNGSSSSIPTGAELIPGLSEALQDFQPVVAQ